MNCAAANDAGWFCTRSDGHFGSHRFRAVGRCDVRNSSADGQCLLEPNHDGRHRFVEPLGSTGFGSSDPLDNLAGRYWPAHDDADIRALCAEMDRVANIGAGAPR